MIKNRLDFDGNAGTNILLGLGLPVTMKNGIVIIGGYEFNSRNGGFVNIETRKRNRGVKNLINILKQEGKLESEVEDEVDKETLPKSED